MPSGTTRCACSPTGTAAWVAVVMACASMQRRRKRATRSIAASGTSPRGICSTSSTARTATTRRAGQTKSLQSRWRIRFSLAATGNPCCESFTTSPKHVDYHPKYYGDLRSRDAAYHQGTVWPWLLGPFVDAWRRTFPDDTGAAARFIAAFAQHLDDACVGSISEIFDAEPPYV